MMQTADLYASSLCFDNADLELCLVCRLLGIYWLSNLDGWRSVPPEVCAVDLPKTPTKNIYINHLPQVSGLRC